MMLVVRGLPVSRARRTLVLVRNTNEMHGARRRLPLLAGLVAMAIALKSYLKKIADPADMAATAGVSFSINHIAAVVLPFALGLLLINGGLVIRLSRALYAGIYRASGGNCRPRRRQRCTCNCC